MFIQFKQVQLDNLLNDIQRINFRNNKTFIELSFNTENNNLLWLVNRKNLLQRSSTYENEKILFVGFITENISREALIDLIQKKYIENREKRSERNAAFKPLLSI